MSVSYNMIIVEPLTVSERHTIICGVTTYKIRILVSLEIERFPFNIYNITDEVRTFLECPRGIVPISFPPAPI